MQKIIPPKLQSGDIICIIAPSFSFSILSEETITVANERLRDLGFKVTFGKCVKEMDEFLTSSVESRISDLHDAFLNPTVKGILTVIGGLNVNQLLRHIDWNIIKNNPKVFCGYSDIDALTNAIYAKTGLVTYSGPHYSTFGQKLYFDYTLNFFKKCLMSSKPFYLKPSPDWTDDEWYIDQDNRKPEKNCGYVLINEGVAEGVLLGANLSSINLLQGTEYLPDLTGTVLFLEDQLGSSPQVFDRDLQSLLHQPQFDQVKALVIGRFQKGSKMLEPLLRKIIKSKKELRNIPVIANIDFGHTEPKNTLPIGGKVNIKAKKEKISIKIIEH